MSHGFTVRRMCSRIRAKIPIHFGMGKLWFVQKGEVVDGPITTEDVQSRLKSGQLTPQHMIWSKGMKGWIRVESWSAHSPISEDQTKEIAIETWHYAHAGKSYGPFHKPQLVTELKNVSDLYEVMLWTKGMKEWASIFEFHDLLNAVGVNKRQFPRADVNGRAVIKTEDKTFIGKLITISEGGCGVLAEGLSPGQTINLEMQSSAFREPLHAKAECRYISDGFAGLKFVQISSETKSSIIQFVKQSQTRFVLKAA